MNDPLPAKTRRLIEDWLPIAAIGSESVRERTPMTPYPAPNRLHVWFARRPLVASRAAILGSLLDAGADRERFLHDLGIHGDPVASRARIDRAKQIGERFEGQAYSYLRAFTFAPSNHGLQTVAVLDPTAGGGSIPFEAVRLGCETIANDLNPVAALLLKATIELPLEFGSELYDRFAKLAAEFVRRRDQILQELIPQEPRDKCVVTNWLWARTIACPYCGGIVPLSPNWKVVEMSAAESSLYSAVEDFISDTFKAAPVQKRSAVGFVMTVYRRRLASSFEALKKTLTGRLLRSGGITEEDISLDETTDEVMSEEEVTSLSAQVVEERDRINDLLRRIAQLGTDSKARRLKAELENCFKDGFDSIIVFTQYTDTMGYLREYLSDQMPDLTVASYSGAGGAWRDASHHWVPCSKEEIKRRLRDNQVRLLVCTDAAGEGLNLQAAGVVVNYDLPWNPMKIEQRIGRIDRLGQVRPVIRVLNFAYKDTVEQDVFFTVGNRINLFHGIVGRLQPILSRLPKRLEELALADRDTRAAERARFLAEIDRQVGEAEKSGFDIDSTVEDSLDLPALPEPPLTLSDLDRVINLVRARPRETEVRPLDAGSYGIAMPGSESVRVTTDAKVFDFSADSHQLFSPGGEVFDSFELDSTPAAAQNGRGVAWLLKRDGGSEEFVVATRFGLQRVQTLGELLVALDTIGAPTDFPLVDWPGVEVSVIA